MLLNRLGNRRNRAKHNPSAKPFRAAHYNDSHPYAQYIDHYWAIEDSSDRNITDIITGEKVLLSETIKNTGGELHCRNLPNDFINLSKPIFLGTEYTIFVRVIYYTPDVVNGLFFGGLHDAEDLNLQYGMFWLDDIIYHNVGKHFVTWDIPLEYYKEYRLCITRKGADTQLYVNEQAQGLRSMINNYHIYTITDYFNKAEDAYSYTGKLLSAWISKKQLSPDLVVDISRNEYELLSDLSYRAKKAAPSILLNITDTRHVHHADIAALTQEHMLSLESTLHSHAADILELAQAHALGISSTDHSHKSDVIDLLTDDALGIQNASHQHTAETLDLFQFHFLAISSASHAHQADILDLLTGDVLQIAGADHAHIADTPALIQDQILAIDSAIHDHVADRINLQGVITTLVISDSLHAHYAENCDIYTGVLGVETPAGRVYLVPKENRVYVVAARQ